jgi:hypothetical protein
MVYSNDNRFIVANAKNILEGHNIEVAIKNEFAAGVIGEVSAFDAWLELWVLNDSDYEQACAILANSLSSETATPWRCEHCHEANDAAFELCWHCQNERPEHSTATR